MTEAPMSETELEAFVQKLEALVASGSEREVRAFIDQQFPRLPENMQNDIAAELLVSAVREETGEWEIAERIQEKGLAAAEVLARIKEELESSEKSEA